MKTIILIAIYFLSFNASVLFAQTKEKLVDNESFFLSLEKEDSLRSEGYYAFGGQWGSSIDLRTFYCNFSIIDSSVVTLKLHDPYFDTTCVIYSCVLPPRNYKYMFGLRPNSQLIKKDGVYDFILEIQNLSWNRNGFTNIYKNTSVDFKSRMRYSLMR